MIGGREISMVRFLNVALLLGLGASLAVIVPRFVSHGDPDKSPVVVAPTPAPPPPLPPPPPAARPARQPIAVRDPATLACYERVRRTHREAFVGDAVRLHLIIGISGRVKYVGVEPPDPRLRPLLPCIRED